MNTMELRLLFLWKKPFVNFVSKVKKDIIVKEDEGGYSYESLTGRCFRKPRI